jgi:hypothetical protein
MTPVFAIELFLHGDVCHRRRWCGPCQCFSHALPCVTAEDGGVPTLTGWYTGPVTDRGRFGGLTQFNNLLAQSIQPLPAPACVAM